MAWSLHHIGPLTRTVQDSALMLQVLAGFDERDSVSRQAPVGDYTTNLSGEVKGLRLGIPVRFFPEYTDPEAKSAFEAAVGVLENLGAHIEEVNLPDLERTGRLPIRSSMARQTSGMSLTS